MIFMKQGLYECGIFSIFLHGSTIPDCYTYRSMGDSVLSITVPSHLKLKIRGLNVCILYALGPCQHLKVSNDTKGLMWTYCPVTVGVPKEDGLMLWLSHWLFENHELEAGDELRVSVHNGAIFFDPLGHRDVLPAKEFGIQLVYESENKDVRSKSEDITVQLEAPYWSYNIVTGNGSLSASKYQMWTGKYFLCNYIYNMRQIHFRNCEENPAHLDFSYEPKDRLSGYCRHLFEHTHFHKKKFEFVLNLFV
ncbi:hypothetical protein RchiOBHm_Chr6g0286441 [Rosa chinensis]|uniref:C-JID domain-containing protein n=1 Tax=Rosa chinensis TaxID=74649 RepID=A0A2P6PUT6_ROSCH|nr:hypothetical protein RchiOBHm_Chr6g0286441 [Rosa chinensis]